MALIKCPECGKEISDKSEKCINCGFPIIQLSKTCIVNGKTCDLSFLLDKAYSLPFKVRDLIQISKSSITYVKPVVDKIIADNEIPKSLYLPIQAEMTKDNDTLHCPKCNSTNIQMVTRKWSLLTGFMTNKVDRVCVNCKYKF